MGAHPVGTSASRDLDDEAVSGVIQAGTLVESTANDAEPHRVLEAAGLPLCLLARRLLSGAKRFESELCERWRRQEPGRVDAALLSAVEPGVRALLEQVSAGRVLLAEHGASDLFSCFCAHDMSLSSVARFVETFEDLALQCSREANFGAAVRELGRFLMRIAIAEATQAPKDATRLQSGERLNSQAQGDLGLVGGSARLAELRETLRDIARAPGAVLLVGESGTGKELVARALHDLGRESASPFLPINCAALPRELVESELFGCEAGAFTGSRERRPGLLRAAGNGTVFLDEITEMPLALQPKLLRALEQRAVRPVGGVNELPIRARLVAATNREPEPAVSDGTLRADLFFRLCVHRIVLPPLRERTEDIAPIALHFLRQLTAHGYRAAQRISPDALKMLCEYSWPGNVRELRNVVEHSVAVSRGAPIEPHNLPRFISATALVSERRRAASPAPETSVIPLRLLEREQIEQALSQSAGNKTRAAKLLGLSRHQLYVRLSRLGL